MTQTSFSNIYIKVSSFYVAWKFRIATVIYSVVHAIHAVHVSYSGLTLVLTLFYIKCFKHRKISNPSQRTS